MPKTKTTKQEKKPIKKKAHKPIWSEKEGNVQLSLFKNKNIKGVKYPKFVFSIFKFPFQYNQKIYFTEQEADKMFLLLKNRPKINRT